MLGLQEIYYEKENQILFVYLRSILAILAFQIS